MRLAGLLLVLMGCDVVFPRAADSCPGEYVPSCTVADPDEDDDGAADDCDPCPAIAAFQSDGDGDGIGDDCDPSPAAPRCPQRRFSGFRDDDGRWVDTTGWVLDGNARSGLMTDDLLILRSSELHGPGRVETVVVDGSHPMDNQLVFAGVVMMATADRGYFCALQPIGGGSGTMLLGRLARTGEQTVLESASFSQTPGFVHRLQLTVTATKQVRCTSHRSSTETPYVFSAMHESSLEFTDSELPAPGGYGVLVRGSLDELEYVELIPE